MNKIREIYKTLEDHIYTEVIKGIDQADSIELGRSISMLKDVSKIRYYNALRKTLKQNTE